MTIDVIFLGLDGVLFDTEALHLAACNRAFALAGMDVRWRLADLRKAAAQHGYATATHAQHHGDAKRRSKEDAAELASTKQRILHQMVTADPLPVLAAAQRLIDDALQAGCKLSILTEMPASTAAAMLEQCFGADVNSSFAVVAGGARWKDPAGTGPYALALHAIGAEPRNAIAIDTAPAALQAARACGLWTVSACPNDINGASISGADLWCPQWQELRQMVPADPPPSFHSLRGMKGDPRYSRRLNLPVAAQSAV